MGQPSYPNQMNVQQNALPSKSGYGDYAPVKTESKVGAIQIDSPNLKVNIDDKGHLGSAVLGGVILGFVIIIVLYLKLGKGKL